MKNIILKKYRYVFVGIIFIIGVIFYGFYKYYDDYYSYHKEYYIIKEDRCNKNKIALCDFLNSDEKIDFYLKNNDPIKKYKKLDTITLTCEIVENSIFRIFQFASPLIIAFMVIGTLHSRMSSGMFKNYLTRTTYNKFLKYNFITIIKIALIMPLSLIFIFLISMFITKFNFNIDQSTKILAVYSRWKYSNFIIYGIIICLIQYILSLTYGLIAYICVKKNKNKLVCIIMSYILFLSLALGLSLGVYSIIVNRILGFKDLYDCFSITGFWFFNGVSSFKDLILILTIPIIILLIFIYITYKVYSTKEEVIVENEKQTS